MRNIRKSTTQKMELHSFLTSLWVFDWSFTSPQTKKMNFPQIFFNHLTRIDLIWFLKLKIKLICQSFFSLIIFDHFSPFHRWQFPINCLIHVLIFAIFLRIFHQLLMTIRFRAHRWYFTFPKPDLISIYWPQIRESVWSHSWRSFGKPDPGILTVTTYFCVQRWLWFGWGLISWKCWCTNFGKFYEGFMDTSKCSRAKSIF